MLDVSKMSVAERAKLLRIIEAEEQKRKREVWQCTINLFPFHKRNRLPTLSNLTAEQRSSLPGTPTHFEWVERVAFGRTYVSLYVWLLGAKCPMHWKDGEGWVYA